MEVLSGEVSSGKAIPDNLTPFRSTLMYQHEYSQSEVLGGTISDVDVSSLAEYCGEGDCQLR